MEQKQHIRHHRPGQGCRQVCPALPKCTSDPLIIYCHRQILITSNRNPCLSRGTNAAPKGGCRRYGLPLWRGHPNSGHWRCISQQSHPASRVGCLQRTRLHSKDNRGGLVGRRIPRQIRSLSVTLARRPNRSGVVLRLCQQIPSPSYATRMRTEQRRQGHLQRNGEPIS